VVKVRQEALEEVWAWVEVMEVWRRKGSIARALRR
jgi:hypothetical protein